MAVAVGLKQSGPVDWSRYEDKLLGFTFDAEDPALGNFLIDLNKDKAVDLLNGQHFGTRSSYNHERYQVAWSPNNRFLVEAQSWRWATLSATLYVLDGNGTITSSMDLLPVAEEQFRIVLERDHKVSRKKFEEQYGVSLWKQSVDSKGRVTLDGTADVAKSAEDPDVSLLIQFTAKTDDKGKLSVENLEVKEKDEEME